MTDCMIFPATFDEFAEQYKIFDEKEIYTNGTALIPIFRVKQWLEHSTNIVEMKHGEWKLHLDGSGTCSQCNFTQKNVWDYDNAQNFCGHCGADMRGEHNG